MTTATPITYSMMEVPVMDDSMEMASPYQGQADDFDIDIDLMEDHASNMDSDMMGADEFTNNSQPNEPQNDTIYDADMADEPSEGSMVDADNYPDEDNDIDVQFEEEPYEEEMIESDPVEEIDRAVTTIDVEITANNAHAASPIKEDATITAAEHLEAAPQGPSGPAEIPLVHQESEALPAEGSDTQPEPSTVDEKRAEELSGNVDSTETSGDHEKPGLTEIANDISQHPVSETEVKDVSKEGLGTSHTKDSLQESEADATGHPEAQPSSEENHQVPAQDESSHQITYMDEPLHAVKILYQNCEIALFPPLEGDAAETFFLQSEDVAYDSIGQLFKHLREVLQKSLDNDVLVIDIETLGIQITEDSSYTSEVTLYQIIDLYLRLCRNDGTNEPDALYLTLSSKRAFSDEILDLTAAAIAGKTLSELQVEIHSWDEYNEAEPGSEDDIEAHGAEEHEDEVYYTNEVQNELSVPEEQIVPKPKEAEVLASDQSQAQAQDVPAAHPEIVQAPDEDASVSSKRGAEVAPESEAHATQSANKEADESEESLHVEEHEIHKEEHADADATEKHYDSEGPQGPQSDSTGTVAGLAGESGIKESTEDVSPDGAFAGTDQTDPENQYAEDAEWDDLEPDEYFEHEDSSPLDDLEATYNENIGDENGDAEKQEPVDQAPVLDEEDEDELEAPPTNEIVSATSVQDEITDPSHDQTAPPLDRGLHHASDKNEQTPDPEDDLLGIAEDLLQTPPRDNEHDTLDEFEGIDYDEPEDEIAAPVAADDGGVDDQEFEENHFGDYDAHFDESETVEVVGADPSVTDSPTKNSSTKRSRDDEDDWDVVETTIDTKRRRSS